MDTQAGPSGGRLRSENALHIALSTLFALLPSLVLLYFFYHRDLNPEPRGVVLRTFLLGILCAIPVLAVAVPLLLFEPEGLSPVAAGLYRAFLCAAIPEELLKFLVLTLYSARFLHFDEPMDGPVYGAAAALGFATLENVLNVLSGGWGVALMRAFTAVPSHAFLGVILGYHVALARFKPEEKVAAWHGLLVVVVLHGLYDFPLMALLAIEARPGEPVAVPPGLLLLVVAVLAAEAVWAWRIVHQLRMEQRQAGPNAD